jgi:hypothetical protein
LQIQPHSASKHSHAGILTVSLASRLTAPCNFASMMFSSARRPDQRELDGGGADLSGDPVQDLDEEDSSYLGWR